MSLWETRVVEPSLDQKVYLVLSVSLATVCLLTNGFLIFIFLRGSARLLQSHVRHLLLFNQIVSGLFTTFIVVYPIQIITSPLTLSTDQSESSFASRSYSPLPSNIFRIFIAF